MRYPFLLIVALCFSGMVPLSAQEKNFAVTPLLSALYQSSDAVIRSEETRFTVESNRYARLEVRKVLTVFTPNGRKYSAVGVPYDNLRRLTAFSGRLFDAAGKEIRTLNTSDTKDFSNISDFSLYEDSRARTAELYHDTYPYTAEFVYTLEFNGYINFPSWSPQEKNIPVESAELIVVLPEKMPLRYQQKNLTDKPQIEIKDGKQRYTWKLTLLPAFKPEPFGPPASEQAMSVELAPTEFEIENSAGTLSSWQSFGDWFRRLWVGRNTLPPNTLADVQRLTAGLSDTDKIKTLYEYLQSKTRYVSVQLGIGGWQPFDATYVCERGYGDCKALTNCMMSLLSASGITSYPALIASGDDESAIDETFPNNQFNHVILFVPLAKDTLWLECTSQSLPLGYVHSGIEDRFALVLLPTGGKLIRTPASSALQNTRLRKARVSLTAIGAGSCQVETVYSGHQQDDIRGQVSEASPEKQQDWLRASLPLSSFEIQAADFSDFPKKRLTLTFPFSLSLNSYATATGNRLFLRLFLLKDKLPALPESPSRKYPLTLSYPYCDIDSVAYRVPTGLKVESLPQPVSIESPFGRYRASVAVEADTIRYVRLLEQTTRTVPAIRYNEYRDFLKKVSQADNATLVLVRKN